MCPSCNTHAQYCHVVCQAVQYIFFSHCLINGTIYENKDLLNIKCFSFSVQCLNETLIILRRFQRHFIKNVHGYSLKLANFYCQLLIVLEFYRQQFRKYLKLLVEFYGVTLSLILV